MRNWRALEGTLPTDDDDPPTRFTFAELNTEGSGETLESIERSHLFPMGIGILLAVIGHHDMNTFTLPISQPNPRLNEVLNADQSQARFAARREVGKNLHKTTNDPRSSCAGPQPLLALSFAGVAHAQGTIGFSGAQTLMGSIKTFCVYAGAIVCFCGLVFAGIRMMSGNITQAIMGLGGAIVGAGVLGWGAGWISSLTGQSVS